MEILVANGNATLALLEKRFTITSPIPGRHAKHSGWMPKRKKEFEKNCLTIDS